MNRSLAWFLNPSCVKCQRRMSRQARTKGPVFLCHRCHETYTPWAEGERASYPWCIACRKRMSPQLRQFRCTRCGAAPTKHRVNLRKARIKRVTPIIARYPYGTSDELVVRINASVPRSLPEDIREDVCQNMLMEILQGAEEQRITESVQRFIREHRRQYPFRYNFSLDAKPERYDRAG